jgi:DNA repair photolyase
MRMGALRLMPRRPKSQLALTLESGTSLPVLGERGRGARFRELPVRQILNSPATTHMPFWSINPYVGCEFGCSYCYARKTHAWAMERAGKAASAQHAWDAFEHEILVKRTAPEVLLKTLDPARLQGRTLMIGTATDPYQPAERTYLLTRRVLQALVRFTGLRVGIITKSPLVARDIDVLRELSGRHDLSVNISLASTDAALLRRIEARSPAPHARLRTLARLTSAGIEAGLLIAPILPAISDSWTQLAALMEAGKEAGARYVVGAALRLGEAARTGFLPLLKRDFPELVERYERRYGTGTGVAREYERALDRRLMSLQAAFGFPVHEGMRRKRQLEGG